MSVLALDKSKVRQAFSGAAADYDAFAALQRHVGLELLRGCPLDARAGTIMDLGCGTGFLTRALTADARFDASLQPVVAVDIALPMLQYCRQHVEGASVQYVCADAEQLPFASGSFQQIVSNVAMQWCPDLSVVLADCYRCLAAEGLLTLAIFGPATLQELRLAWAAVDSYAHVNRFYSQSEIMGFLKAAGFDLVVNAVALHTVDYPSVMALMRALKAIGAHNVNQQRKRAPTTRQQLQRMMAHYPQTGDSIIASYDVLFFQARRPL